MKFRNVGKSGLKVSEITLGSWLTYGKTVEDNLSTTIIEAALEAGINSFDCADVYEQGAAEIVLGKALSKYKRSDVVVSTKVFWPMSDNINDCGLSRKHIIESIDKSLERLQMDYVDIYYCHRFDENTPLEETLEALHDVIKSNKALYIGVSMWSAKQIVEAHDIIKTRGFTSIIVNQPPYNMINRDIEAYDMPVQYTHGISQMVYSPLAQGILTGKYNDGIPSGSRMTNESISTFIARDFELNVNMAKEFSKVSTRLDISLAQLALAWILNHQEVASAIIGATSVKQLEENIKAVDIELSSKDMNELNIIYLNNKI